MTNAIGTVVGGLVLACIVGLVALSAREISTSVLVVASTAVIVVSGLGFVASSRRGVAYVRDWAVFLVAVGVPIGVLGLGSAIVRLALYAP